MMAMASSVSRSETAVRETAPNAARSPAVRIVRPLDERRRVAVAP